MLWVIQTTMMVASQSIICQFRLAEHILAVSVILS